MPQNTTFTRDELWNAVRDPRGADSCVPTDRDDVLAWARQVARSLADSEGYAEALAERITDELGDLLADCDGTEPVEHVVALLEQTRMPDYREWLADEEDARREDEDWRRAETLAEERGL